MGTRGCDISLWERLQEERAAQREQERLQMLERAVALLQQYFASRQVDAVYLTGSILREGRFYPFSDIDVAVEGLREDYLRTMVDLERLLDRDIDLIELEKCPFRDAILRRGMRIR